MCGFAGIINLKGLKRDHSLDIRMNKALDILYPRGPDQKGKWVDINCIVVDLAWYMYSNASGLIKYIKTEKL